MNCYGCGAEGHLERDCPNVSIDADGKPSWCGFCDEQTRLIDRGDSVSRCQRCHPQRHQRLRQFRKCPTCHVTVYQWDNGRCGEHSSPDAVAGSGGAA